MFQLRPRNIKKKHRSAWYWLIGSIVAIRLLASIRGTTSRIKNITHRARVTEFKHPRTLHPSSVFHSPYIIRPKYRQVKQTNIHEIPLVSPFGGTFPQQYRTLFNLRRRHGEGPTVPVQKNQPRTRPQTGPPRHHRSRPRRTPVHKPSPEQLSTIPSDLT